MISPAVQAGLWGLLAGAALVLGAAAAWFVAGAAATDRGHPGHAADTMIPEAFEHTHNAAGLITVVGFFTAFMLSKLGGCAGT